MRTGLLAMGAVLGSACLANPVTSAQGFLCEIDGDCDDATWCIEQRCVPRVDPSTRPTQFNTGAPHDIGLTPSGPVTANQDNQVIENLDIEGCVEIRAQNVTLRRSRIRCGSGFYGIAVFASGLVVEDVEFDGTGSSSLTAFSGSVTVRRTNVHHVYRVALLGSDSLFETSYIHDLTGSTVMGIAVGSAGASNLEVRQNSVELLAAQAGTAIEISAGSNPIDNALVTGNWVNGGTYSIRAGAANGSNIQVKDNRFGRTYDTGPLWIGPNAQQSGNVFDDDNSPVPLP